MIFLSSSAAIKLGAVFLNSFILGVGLYIIGIGIFLVVKDALRRIKRDRV